MRGILVVFWVGVACGMPQQQQYGVPEGRVMNSQGGMDHDLNLIAGALDTSSQGEVETPPEDSFLSSLSPSLSLEEMEKAMGSPKVYKHISIHIPPRDEFEVPMTRVIRPMSGGDKHVNIIFVKAPSGGTSQETEVILPEESQHKTVVYVLLKKGSGGSDVRLRQPEPTKPSRPEVFFVKYEGGSVGGERPEYGVPS